MLVQVTGAALLAVLMRLDRDREADSAWLLFGPTDPDVVEQPDAAPPILLLAAE